MSKPTELPPLCASLTRTSPACAALPRQGPEPGGVSSSSAEFRLPLPLAALDPQLARERVAGEMSDPDHSSRLTSPTLSDS